MTVDIIIPNYNGSDLIENNLPFVIKALNNYEGKIILVDDGSTIEDQENLRNIVNKFVDSGSKIELIKHTKNKGFSSAVNSGVKKSNAKIIVLLNSDVIPSDNFMKSPIKQFEDDENLFGVGCMDQSIESGRTVLRGRGIGRWVKGMLLHSKGEVNSADNTFWVSGGSCFIRRDIYEKLNGMDEIYNPFYWEDIDLSYRAQKMGYKVMFDNKSVVKHFHDQGAIMRNYSNKKVTAISYRNQFIFIWKNITDFELFFNHILLLPYNFYGAIKRSDWSFVIGFFLALKRLPDIINKRIKQKKLYIYSDRFVLEKFK